MSETKHYPTRCLSAYCGRSGPECNSTCTGYPALQDFKNWVRETGAKCVDPIWSPTIYRSET